MSDKIIKPVKILPTKQDVESLEKPNPSLPSTPFLMLCFAPPGSGKSVVAVNMAFSAYNSKSDPIYFKRVIWISPSVYTDRSLSSVRKLAADEENDQIEIQLIGDGLDKIEVVIDEVIKYLGSVKEDDAQQNIRTILIIDDAIALLKRNYQSTLLRLCSTYRHLAHSLSIILCSQTWKAIPKPVREMASCYIILGCGGGKMKKEMIEDLENTYGENVEEYLDECLTKRFDMCYIDNREQTIMKNFGQKLLFNKN